MPSNRSAQILQSTGEELRDNPPRALLKTRRKFGRKRAARQRTAILLSKARAEGANV